MGWRVSKKVSNFWLKLHPNLLIVNKNVSNKKCNYPQNGQYTFSLIPSQNITFASLIISGNNVGQQQV